MVTGLFFISPLSRENGLIVLLLVGKKTKKLLKLNFSAFKNLRLKIVLLYSELMKADFST